MTHAYSNKSQHRQVVWNKAKLTLLTYQRALGLSDHCMVHLIPTYRQKLKSAKPVVKTVKRWTNETEWVLQACLDLTDWSVFEAAANDLDELTETVTSYISFCEDMCIPTRTHLTYNNDKPWFTAKLRQLRQAKEDAYRKGDKVLYKQAKYTLEKEIRVAKRNYSDKLRIQFSSSDSASVWKGLKDIANYKTPSPSSVENQQQADNLNEFYCRFEKTPHTHPEHLSTQPLTPPATPLPHTCNSDKRRRGAPGLPETEKEKSTRPRRCHTSLSEILCWSAGPHLHKDLQQITGTVRSPFMLQMLHHHPHPKEIQNYRTKWLQACGSNVCGHEVIWKTGAGPPEGHHWTLAGSSSVCLQSKQVCGRCSQHGTALCSATSRPVVLNPRPVTNPNAAHHA